ncbi:MAG: acyl-CoA dehydrogenase family protein [Nitratireductor sp.]
MAKATFTNSSNQAPIFGGHNAYKADPLLMLVSSALTNATKAELEKLGNWAGSKEVMDLARLANLNTPILKSHDLNGDRSDQIEFHPAYQAFMRKSFANGLHSSPWDQSPKDKGQKQLARATSLYLTAGVESGHLEAVSSTNASIATLLKAPSLIKEWLPLLVSRKYDSSNNAPAKKSAITISSAFSERQSGSDLTNITTTASTTGDGIWRLKGNKWFVSAPMSDAFLVAAKTPKGISCFLMPRLLPNGENNQFQLTNIKDNLGNRSNAACEAQLNDALAQIIGKEGEGIAAIAEMQKLVRLDSSIISCAVMHNSVWEAVEHCRHRIVGGAPLIEQPLMQRVLADMALDVAASKMLCFRLVSAMDRSGANPSEKAYATLMTPVIKYWTNKLVPAITSEAMECVGVKALNNEANIARHYKDAPINGLWEGAGNQLCLETLDLISKRPEILDSVLVNLERDLGGQSASKTIDVIRTASTMAKEDRGSARILIEQLALTAAASELKRIGLTELADSFIETRLGGLWRSSYGMLDSRQNAQSILKALYPKS